MLSVSSNNFIIYSALVRDFIAYMNIEIIEPEKSTQIFNFYNFIKNFHATSHQKIDFMLDR